MAAFSQSIAAFPAWALLNGIDITSLKLEHIHGKGFGFVADGELNSSGNHRTDTSHGEDFLNIPRDLVLSADAVNEYAKVDQNFRQLLETAGRHLKSTRGSIVLYLFSHLTSSSQASTGPRNGIASTAWTEYIKLLPQDIPVPTLWSDDDRGLLQGTSLEVALVAKMRALEAEFEQLRENTTSLPFWHARWWDKEIATLGHWILADAWYRSRCLELPQAGEAMVPGLDMINHSYSPTALYDELNSGDVTLRIRPGCSVADGEEISITYGETKSAAEMLFSYGFIDSSSAARELTIPLDSMSDDPLGKAKLHAYGRSPTVKISQAEGKTRWESPFMHLMCLNEEDGLDFRVLQDQDGDRHLRTFWQDQDVTEQVGAFTDLIQGHPHEQVFRLRTAALLQEIVASQLERIRLPLKGIGNLSDGPARPSSAGGDSVEAAMVLRTIETEILEAAVAALEAEKTTLLQDARVLEYLGQMEDGPNEQVAGQPTNDEPDFS